jgi:hypothetical protein
LENTFVTLENIEQEKEKCQRLTGGLAQAGV